MKKFVVSRLALIVGAAVLGVAACSTDGPNRTIVAPDSVTAEVGIQVPGVMSVCISPASPAGNYSVAITNVSGILSGDIVSSSPLVIPANSCGQVIVKGNSGQGANGIWPSAFATLTVTSANAGTYSFTCLPDGNKLDHCSALSGTSNTMTAGVSKPHGSLITFTLTPPAQTLYTLTTSTAGAGTGTISPAPPTSSYSSGTTVPVTAVADAGSVFTGFSGDCTGTGSCSVLMNANKAVVANFALIPPTMYTLTTSTAGAGTGTISPAPPTSSYSSGTTVPVTAVADAGSVFTGFSGGVCSGTGACSVLMDANKAVVANFALIPIGTPLFVIGDVEAHGIGTTVNFWGAQWWKNNFMSGIVDHGTASFKGYATQASNRCGETWISRVGNSPPPPATIPTSITIIVTSTVRKIGPDIGGDIVQIITVDQDGGYGPNPGHRGNGVVTKVDCSTR